MTLKEIKAIDWNEEKKQHKKSRKIKDKKEKRNKWFQAQMGKTSNPTCTPAHVILMAYMWYITSLKDFMVCFPFPHDPFIFYTLNYCFYYCTHEIFYLYSTFYLFFLFLVINFSFSFTCYVFNIVLSKFCKCLFCLYVQQQVQQNFRLCILIL